MSDRGAQLRIATLNCLNLTLPGHAPYAEVAAPTAEQYQARINWLARMLARLDADFVLVQEVFHLSALAAAVARSGLELDCAAPLAGDDNRKPRVGLVWRRPWQPRIESISAFPAGCAVAIPELGERREFSRPPLRATVAIGAMARPLALLNLHLKSRRPLYAADDDPGDPRARARAELRALLVRGTEAAAVRSLVLDGIAGDEALVVGGDFNAGPTAAPTGIVRGAGASAPGVPGPDVLVDALALAPDGDPAAPTYLDGGTPERIDHLLVSAHFATGAAGRVVRVETLGEHLRPCTQSDTGAPREPAPVRIESDHAAVLLTLTLAGK